MSKRGRVLLKIFLSMVGLTITKVVASLILRSNNMKFRIWVEYTFFCVMVLLFIALLVGIIYTLSGLFSMPQKQKWEGITLKISCACGMIATLIATALSIIYVPFLWAFCFDNEHVIEKHGQKMVAYVESFLKVRVRYHEYKNFLVCGYDTLGMEFYGSGSYDPFKMDPVPETNVYYFYNTQGEVIVQSELFSEKASDEKKEKESKKSVFPPKKMRCEFAIPSSNVGGWMRYTEDGENWEERDVGYHYQYVFDSIGYLVFSYDWAMQEEAAAIYKSTDGGQNWTFVSATPSNDFLRKATFFDENTGIFEYGMAQIEDYVIYVTTDGMETLEKIDIPLELEGQTEEIKEYIFQTK